jgi:hypothetical protein
MANIKISVINESTVVPSDDVARATVDLQTQVSRDFSVAWGVDADLVYVAPGAQPATGSWWLTILDDTDQAGALGYHDTTDEGLPLGKVFARTDQQAQSAWTVTASHELLEMLGDPDINLAALVQDQDGNVSLYAYEVADACEADAYGYLIGNTMVSDFVFPSWFQSFVPAGSKLDQQGKIQQPFEILPGGYISVLDIASTNGWQQLSGAQAQDRYSSRAHVGSRRERRRTPRDVWLRSTKRFSSSPSEPVQSLSKSRKAGGRVFRVEGKMSTFGGPDDPSTNHLRPLALFEESDLDDPKYSNLFLPGGTLEEVGLTRRLNPDANYVACRWEYGITSRDLLRRTQVVITNPRTGATAFASPVDWGPGASTGRVALVSPGLAKILGLGPDDDVSVSVSLR